MCIFYSLTMFVLLGSAFSEFFRADVNMMGIRGSIELDYTLKIATTNLSDVCENSTVSLHEFPVMYGHFSQPCLQMNIGKMIYNFTFIRNEINITELIKTLPDLSDTSIVFETCDGLKACSTVKKNKSVRTWQAKFFDSIAGTLYIRQNIGEHNSRVLTDFVTIMPNVSDRNLNVSVYFADGNSTSICDDLARQRNKVLLGEFRVGLPFEPMKSRKEIAIDDMKSFALLEHRGFWSCAEVRELEAKLLTASINMKGIKGIFSFSQNSPFDLTTYNVSLEGLKSLVGPYHIHQFPVPQRKSSQEQLCSDDNTGGHWNPFGLDTTNSTYPKVPGQSHDKYEVGDLSGRHGSLQDKDTFVDVFNDWNLPLFGKNSIAGRSVVIHKRDTSRHVCGNIRYNTAVITAHAIFRSPVVGRIVFQQMKSNPYSDVSIFMELSYGNASSSITNSHKWHVHEYPVSATTDFDENMCLSTKGHFNPFKVDTVKNYSDCSPGNPFRCETGDYAGKHKTITLTNRPDTVTVKNFFTDSTSALSGTASILNRAIVIHGPDNNGSRLACANITVLHPSLARAWQWFGAGKANGNIAFSQSSDLDPTTLNVSLNNLNNLAGDYHVHLYPVRTESSDPCGGASTGGHFNPFEVNVTASPAPGNGTNDQYEVGDISGKFHGTLKNQTNKNAQYSDVNMPLFGTYSIIGHSVVIHYTSGARMQCANIERVLVNTDDSDWICARAVFKDAIKGTVTLSQQVFSDGSFSDATVEVDLQATDTNNIKEAKWYVYSKPVQEMDMSCGDLGGHYNPFGIDTGPLYNFSCSMGYPLYCEVGDMTMKHKAIILGSRQLLNDANLPLSGDFTVVGRSLVLQNDVGSHRDCATISPDSPHVTLVFPTVNTFDRYEFRHRVANVLQLPLWKITIIPGGPTTVSGGTCQQVSFYVAGQVDKQKLDTIKDQEALGKFKSSSTCNTAPSGEATAVRTLKFPACLFLLLLLLAQYTLCFIL
ncbi:uncharacterized protein LOC122788835 [Protopterus annectens]|uniref:uncharacterized protein LOC122788835 n=1 Tax=Protopterus annectens TaxID=7888 RepID=UPI001CFC18BD|nr:uncharacterized protein LOC122788835 [Protopterus annectens]